MITYVLTWCYVTDPLVLILFGTEVRENSFSWSCFSILLYMSKELTRLLRNASEGFRILEKVFYIFLMSSSSIFSPRILQKIFFSFA